MAHAHSRVAVGILALLLLAPTVTMAQSADDSREKSEKVSAVLAAL
jgi:hypothetical protein